MLIKLRYGNTNTFFLRGTKGGLLVDTDYAGTLPAFFRAIKQAGIGIQDITYMMATHYHPDHIGLVSELQALGVRLVVLSPQLPCLHFADDIFARDRRLQYRPIDEDQARIITCEESRSFLAGLGIAGEILSTPSHSSDSVCVMLDGGECIVGDLEPQQYLAAYDENPELKEDWERILRFPPKEIHYGHI